VALCDIRVNDTTKVLPNNDNNSNSKNTMTGGGIFELATLVFRDNGAEFLASVVRSGPTGRSSVMCGATHGDLSLTPFHLDPYEDSDCAGVDWIGTLNTYPPSFSVPFHLHSIPFHYSDPPADDPHSYDIMDPTLHHLCADERFQSMG
jgi:hypothetical protein